MSVCRKCDVCGTIYDPPTNFYAILKKERESPATQHVWWVEVCSACTAAIEVTIKRLREAPVLAPAQDQKPGGRL